MRQPSITGNINFWLIIPTLLPLIFGMYVISKLKWETQVQRFYEDPLGFTFVGIIVYGLFFGMPIIFSLFFKVIKIEGHELIVKYPIRQKEYRFFINQIRNFKTRYGSSRGIGFKEFEIYFHDRDKVVFNSKQITNFDKIVSYIKENKRTVGNTKN